MSIRVTCLACGKVGKVDDSAAGKRIRCPGCGEAFLVGAAPLTEAVESPIPEPSPSPRRPFYRDPVVLVGAMIPCLILGPFLGYLARERSRQAFAERIVILKADADRDAAAGRVVEAVRRYDEIHALTADRDPLTPEAREAVPAAEVARRDLRYKLAEITRRKIEAEDARRVADEAEAKHKIFEAKRLAEEKAMADAAERERVAIAETEAAEAKRLAAIRATVGGGVWINKKGGQSDIIRGTNIYVLPSQTTLKRALPLIGTTEAIADTLLKSFLKMNNRYAKDSDVAMSEAGSKYYRELLADLKEFREQHPDTLVDLSRLAKFPLRAFGEGMDFGEGITYIGMKQFEAFEELARDLAVAKATTGIDGKYVIAGVPGGVFLVYARHLDMNGYIDWLEPLKVENSQAFTLDLFNENAMTIANNTSDD